MTGNTFENRCNFIFLTYAIWIFPIVLKSHKTSNIPVIYEKWLHFWNPWIRVDDLIYFKSDNRVFLIFDSHYNSKLGHFNVRNSNCVIMPIYGIYLFWWTEKSTKIPLLSDFVIFNFQLFIANIVFISCGHFVVVNQVDWYLMQQLLLQYFETVSL